jgi:hypothetical protein
VTPIEKTWSEVRKAIAGLTRQDMPPQDTKIFREQVLFLLSLTDQLVGQESVSYEQLCHKLAVAERELAWHKRLMRRQPTEEERLKLGQLDYCKHSLRHAAPEIQRLLVQAIEQVSVAAQFGHEYFTRTDKTE